MEPRMRGSAMGDLLPSTHECYGRLIYEIHTMKIGVYVHVLRKLCETLDVMFYSKLFQELLKNYTGPQSVLDSSKKKGDW